MSDEKTSTPASNRANEAWESVPGDSEQSVDYKPTELKALPELVDYHELTVEISVRMPCGTAITHTEIIECKDESDYTLTDAISMLDAGYRVMADRLGR